MKSHNDSESLPTMSRSLGFNCAVWSLPYGRLLRLIRQIPRETHGQAGKRVKAGRTLGGLAPMALYSSLPRIIFMTSSISALTSSMPATSSNRTPVSRRSTPTLNSIALCRPNSSASSCAPYTRLSKSIFVH